MTRAVGYVRVSTADQAEHGVSLEAQTKKLEAYAALYDLELVAIEVDAGESAGSLERPALRRALATLRKVDALVVVKLDRLTRSVRDLGELLEKHFRKRALLSVSEQVDTRTAAGELVLNLLTSVGQWERKAIGERTSAAMQHMRAEGRYTGGEAPLGYARAGEGLITAPAEYAVIVEARRLRAAGLSVRAIAATLTETGHKLRGEVTFGKVQRALAAAPREVP